MELYRSGYPPSRNRLLALIVQLASVEDWSLNGPGAELPDQDRAWLLVQLGSPCWTVQGDAVRFLYLPGRSCIC